MGIAGRSRRLWTGRDDDDSKLPSVGGAECRPVAAAEAVELYFLFRKSYTVGTVPLLEGLYQVRVQNSQRFTYFQFRGSVRYGFTQSEFGFGITRFDSVKPSQLSQHRSKCSQLKDLESFSCTLASSHYWNDIMESR
ncbi:hypothetical protein Hdeb2414_s0017g00508881 [Helianthus debilis subsp. tardiflorus]